MMRKLAGALVTISALGADLSYGLGIADTHIESALNQPLKAVIHLSEVKGLTPDAIQVALAGSEEFIRAGVDRQFFLSDLRFEVKQSEQAQTYIEISSERPIKEPFLNFLLELQWPDGRMLREFTFLLDPPGQAGQLAVSLNVSPTQPYTVDLAATQTLAAPAAGSPTEGTPRVRVTQYDTLWSIARQYRPDGSVTIKQAMLAIQEANPHAFPSNNINDMEIGSTLRIPAVDVMRKRTAREAEQEVRRQNMAWVALKRQGTAAERSPQPANDNEKVLQDAASTPAAPKEPTPSPTPQAALPPQTVARIEKLEQALAKSQAVVVQAEQERDAIKAQLDALQQQLASLQQQVRLKDDQLVAMAQRLEEQAQHLREREQAHTSAKAANETVVTQRQESELVPAVTARPPQKPQPEAPQPTPPAPATGTDPVWLTAFNEVGRNPLLYGGAGAGGLALLLALLMWRRRRRASEVQADTAVEQAAAQPESAPAQAEKTSSAAGFDDLLAPDLELTEADLEPLEVLDEPETTAATAKQRQTVQPQEVDTPSSQTIPRHDPLGEADIYIAYGRYEQAAGLLQRAIAEEPERADLRLKLLEVLIELEDEATFAHQEQELANMGSQAVLNQAAELRQRLDARLAKAAQPSAGDAVAGALAGTAAAGGVAELRAEELAGIQRDASDEVAKVDAPSAVTDDEDLLELDTLGDFDFELTGDELAALESDAEPSQQAGSAEQASTDAVDKSAAELDLSGLSFYEEMAADESGSTEQAEAMAQADEQPASTMVEQLEPLELSEHASVPTEPPAADADALLSDAGADDEVAASEAAGATAPQPSADALLDAEFEALLADVQDFGALDVDAEKEPAPTTTEAAADTPKADAIEKAFELDLNDVAELEELGDALELEGELPDLDSFTLEDLDDPLELSDDGLETNGDPTTQLDLARAYMDMGDPNGARVALQEVMAKGDEQQRQEARTMLEKLET